MIAASDFLGIHPTNSPKSKHFGAMENGSFAAALAQQGTKSAELVADGGKILPLGELPGGNDLPVPQAQAGQNPALANAQPDPLQPEVGLPEAAPSRTEQVWSDGIVPVTGSADGIVFPAAQLPALQSADPSTISASSKQEFVAGRSAVRAKGPVRNNGKPQTSEATEISGGLAQAQNSGQSRNSERLLSALLPASPTQQMAGALPARRAVLNGDAAPVNPGGPVRPEPPSIGPVRAEYALDMKVAGRLVPTIPGGIGDAPSLQMQQLPPLALSVADGAPRPGPEAAPRFGPDSAAQAQSQDFSSLVDRLAEAREAARSQTVRMAVPHADFGEVSLRFRQADGGLSVAMSSADPEFSRAVQAAMPAERANNGQDNPPSSRQDDAMRQPAAGQSEAEGRQAGDRQDEHAGPQAQPGGEREADRIQNGQADAHEGNSQAGSSGNGRGGIFA